MTMGLMHYLRRWHVRTLKAFGVCGGGELKVTLGDVRESVAEELARAFENVPAVEVVCGDLMAVSCDAIVSAANSFGDMGGGIDQAIDGFHGGRAQRAVVAAIGECWFGELPVGAGMVVEVGAGRLGFVVAAPTMRVPGSVMGTANAYLAMRAALVAVYRHNGCGGGRSGRMIRSVAVPGLGMGVGGMRVEEASEQMRGAYASVVEGGWRHVTHAAQAPFLGRSMGGKGRIINCRQSVTPSPQAESTLLSAQFPLISGEQVAVLAAKVLTGQIVTTDGEVARGGDKMVWRVFPDIGSARAFVLAAITMSELLEYVVHDRDGLEIEMYRPEWST
jgi:O-acetyl-ADP-ribose deacetylase (regulator of RNase III)